MLFVRHSVTVKSEIHPRRIVLVAPDHYGAFYDKKVAVFILDEVLLGIYARKLLSYEFLECLVSGANSGNEANLALVVIIVEQVEVVVRVVSRIHDARRHINPHRVQVQEDTRQRGHIDDVSRNSPII